MIPLYLKHSLIQHVTEEWLRSNAQRFNIVRNRRGYIKRAYCKPSQSLDTRPVSSLGVSFQQSLPSGRVWALRGVRGSK